MTHDPSGTYVRGRFVAPGSVDGELEARSPADLDDDPVRYAFSLAHVDDAVIAAREAAPAWDALGLEARAAHLARFRDVIAAHEDEIARTITREMGKVLREGRAEARAMVAKVDITLGEGIALARDWSLENGRLACRYRPHGVLAVIGPFNFPLHLAHGHVAPALLAGNAVVFKPSEVTPGCGALYARMADAAGLPPGVVNVVQGDARVGQRLSTHDDVDGVLFTGSYEVGTRILRDNAANPGKLLALEMGGRNAALVLDDAPFEKSLADVLLSAFSTTGQRCTCASRLIVTRAVAEPFVERLAALAAGLRAGHPLDAGVFMGPLASPASQARFRATQRAADAEGSACVIEPATPEVAFEGRARRGCYEGARVRRVARDDPGSAYQREEVFGPDLTVWVADDVDHAVALANDSPYGLMAGVWTASEAAFERCARDLRVGNLTWNAVTVGASSRLPFGGLKRSGNHRPAAVTASLYCAWPQAITRGAAGFDASALPPGVPRDLAAKPRDA